MKRKRIHPALLLAVCLVVLFLLVQPRVQTIAVSTPQIELENAWRAAQAVGTYHYGTSVVQTSHPTPNLANAGLSSSTARFYLEGETDRARDALRFKLWSNGGRVDGGQNAVEIKVENGRSYGRVSDLSDWRDLGEFSGVFAPNGDPLGYLVAARNVHKLGVETRQLAPSLSPPPAGGKQGGVLLSFTRYSFDISGLAFAEHIRDLLQDELTRKGKLPAGLTLDTPRPYVDMKGSGEMWVNADGLPIRQIIHLEFPPQRGAQEWVEADITSDFSQWQSPRQAGLPTWGAALGRVLSDPRQLIPDSGAMYSLLIVALLALLFYLLVSVRFARRRAVYAAVVGAVIASMTVGPLLQSVKAAQFMDEQAAQQAQADQKQQQEIAARQVEAQLSQANQFDPHADPLRKTQDAGGRTQDAQSAGGSTQDAGGKTQDALLLATSNLQSAIQNPQSAAPAPPPTDPGTDTDGDGLSDYVEGKISTDPAKADTDGDGLNDRIEVAALGASPTNADSDGDQIQDSAEVRGFVDAAGKHWYLNVTHPDSNGDGRLDSIECPQLAPGGAGGACQDTDGDGTPDVFDFDDDNDGAPDSVDAAPTAVIAGGRNDDATLKPLPDGALNLQLSGWDATVKTPLFVDLQLRPANPKHLWYTGNVLDWPSDDRGGQIMRVLTNTLKSYAESQGETSSTREANGDLKLIPLLEIEIPYEAGRFGNLPVKPGLDATKPVTPLAPIENWADTAQLDNFGMSPHYIDNNGTLGVYVPLSLVNDPNGNTPVAFSARILYQPVLSTFGQSHKLRLIWLMQALNDSCDTTGMADWWKALPNKSKFTVAWAPGVTFTTADSADLTDPNNGQDAWCAGAAHWKSKRSIVHTFYDDWFLTGLAVRQDYGLKVGIVSENPSWSGRSSYYERGLWRVSQGLQYSFLTGRVDASGQRDVTVDTVKARFDKDSNSASTATQRWGLDADALQVRTYSFPDQTWLATIPMTHTKQVLSAISSARPVSDTTLLFVREETFRAAGLESSGVVTDDLAAVSLDPAKVKKQVMASMNWSPYRYKGAGVWETYPVDEYWPVLENRYLSVVQRTPDANWPTADSQVGAMVLAKHYFLSVYSGDSRIVENDGVPIGRPTPHASLSYALTPQAAAEDASAADQESKGDDEIEVDYGKAEEMAEAIKEAAEAWKELFEKSAEASWAKTGVNTAVAWAVGITTLLEAMGALSEKTATLITTAAQVLQGAISALKFIWDSEFTKEWSATRKGVITGVGLAVGIALGTLKALFPQNKIVNGILDAISLGVKMYGIVKHIQEMVKLGEKTMAALKSAEKAEELLAEARTGPAIIGLVVTLVASVGMFFAAVWLGHVAAFSLDFDKMLAQLVATIIVTVIMFIIAAIPVIGQLIVAVIGLIDLLIGWVCDLVSAVSGEDFRKQSKAAALVCSGLVEVFTKLVAYLIYSNQPIVDVNNKDHLAISNFDAGLVNSDVGFITGNAFHVRADVGARLFKNSCNGIASCMFGYMFRDQHVQDSTFRYTFVLTKTDPVTPVNIGQMNAEWQSADEDYRYYITQTVSTDLLPRGGAPLDQAGINQPISLFLAENYAVRAQECAGLGPFAGCWWRTKKDVNFIDMGDKLKFDVIPGGDTPSREPAALAPQASNIPFNALDAFYTFADRGNGSVALGWDSRFPTLADADGDGLRSQAFGGPDPDDAEPDSDGDGLSDFWEIQNAAKGYDPMKADADDDSLTDDWEAFFKTRPDQPDTDGDGLLDGEEVFHPVDENHDGIPDYWIGGWEYVYDFDAHRQPLVTYVTSNPTLFDTDGDGISDKLEKVYGYNPRVPNELVVLTGKTQVNDTLGFARPGQSLVYTATVKNELHDRFALGQVAVVNPPSVISVSVQPMAFALQPMDVVTQTGSLQTQSHLAASMPVSLTSRAGAVVVDKRGAAGGRALWQHLDGNLTDDSTLNNNAACSGNCVFYPSGYRGQAARLDGASSLVVSDSASLRLGALSLGAWISPTRVSTASVLFAKDNPDGSHNYGLALGNDGKVTLQIGAQTLVSSGAVNWNAWNHVFATFGNRRMAIYLNGALDISVTVPLTGAPSAAGNSLVIGQNLTGLLDEVEIYPRALDDQAIYDKSNDPLLSLSFENNSFADGSNFQQHIECGFDAGYQCPSLLTDGGPMGGYANFSDYNEGWYRLAYRESLNLNRRDGFFTYAFWLKPAATGGEELGVVGERVCAGKTITCTASTADYPTVYQADQKLRVRFGAGDQVCDSSLSGNILTLDQWQHVIVVFDGAQFHFYVNGQEKSVQSGANCQSRKPAPAPVGTEIYSRSLKIANIDPGHNTGDGYRGGLDEAQLYGYALDASGAQLLYAHQSRALRLMLDEPPGADRFKNSLTSAVRACSDDNCVNSISNSEYGALSGACSGDSCPASGVPGRSNQAVSFDGVNDAVTLDTADKLGLRDKSFTAMAWVKASDLPTNCGAGDVSCDRAILGADGPDSDNQGLYLVIRNGQPYMGFRGNDLAGNTTLLPGQWYHLVFRYDKSKQEQAIFVNGALDKSETGHASFQGASVVYIGRAFGGRFFNGLMDEVSLFNRALTDAEIGQAMTEVPLVNLHLDEPTGATTFSNTSFNSYTAACPAPSDGIIVDDGDAGFTLTGTWTYAGESSSAYDGTYRHTSIKSSPDAAQVVTWTPTLPISDTYQVFVWSAGLSDSTHHARYTIVHRSGSTQREIDQTQNSGQWVSLGAYLFGAGRGGSVSLNNDTGETPMHSILRIGAGPAVIADAIKFVPQHLAGPFAARCPQSGAKGQMRDGLVLDGQDDHLTLPNADTLGLKDSSFTVLAWVRAKDLPTCQSDADRKLGLCDRAILGTDGAGDADGLRLVIRDGRPAFGFGPSDGGRDLTGTQTLLPNQWIHLAFRYDKSAGQAAILVNGLRNAVAQNWNTSFPGSGPVRIGRALGGRYWAGNLDELAIYPSALLDDEIKQIYDYESAWYDVTFSHRFTLDADLPIAVLRAGAGYVRNTDTVLAIVARDLTSRVVSADYKVDDGDWHSAAQDGDVWAFVFNANHRLLPGLHSVFVRATDLVGNVSPQTVRPVFIDGVPPAVTLAASDTLAQGVVYDSARDRWLLGLSGTANDDHGLSHLHIAMCTASCGQDAGGLTVGEAQDVQLSGAQGAARKSAVWTANFPFASPPQGAYAIAITAYDLAGNSAVYTRPVSQTMASLRAEGMTEAEALAAAAWTPHVDADAPWADVTYTGNPDPNKIVGAGAVIRGAAYDIPYLPRPRLFLHFEEPAGATRFYDASSFRSVAQCSTCPTSGAASPYGSALSFDGTQSLSIGLDQGITNSVGSLVNGLTVMAWVNLNSASGAQTILAADQTHSANGWGLFVKDGGLRFNAFGVKTYDSTAVALSTGVWHHVAAVMSRRNAVTFYVDGQPQETITHTVPAQANLDDGVLLGQNLNGRLDEVVVYDRALTVDQARNIANPASRGALMVQAAFVPYKDRDHPDPQWQLVWQSPLTSTGPVYATWSYTVPAQIGGQWLEGPYQLYLRTTDQFGQQRDLPNIWSGDVDTAPPRITLEKFNASGGQADYKCDVHDYFLTTSGYNCAGRSDYNLTQSYMQEQWYKDLFPQDNSHLIEFVTDGRTVSPQNDSAYACDAYGNCATQNTPTLMGQSPQAAAPQSFISSPLNGQVITALLPITVSGQAIAPDSLQSLTVIVSNTTIHNQTWPATGVTTTDWITTWTPAAEGVYPIQAIVRDHVGRVVTSSSEPAPFISPTLLYVDTTAPAISLSTAAISGTDWDNGWMRITGLVTEAAAMARLEAQVNGGAWQAIPVGAVPVSLQPWTGRVYAGTNAPPDGVVYTLIVRAIDVAGRQATDTRAVWVNVALPDPVTLTMMYGAVQQPGSVFLFTGGVVSPGMTIHDMLSPTLVLTWTPSASADVAGYTVEWIEQITQTSRILRSLEVSSGGPYSDTFTAGEAQKLFARLTLRDTVGNTTMQTLGPVYVDYATTPVYADMGAGESSPQDAAHGKPYRSWLDEPCNLIGVDYRASDRSNVLDSLKDEQRFYAAWNAEGLRLAWTGANWNTDGDLFIYLDAQRQAGGSSRAYNPYPATISDTIVILPSYKNAGVAINMQADYVIWVQSNTTATLMTWTPQGEGGSWTPVSGLQYVFDGNLKTPTTDLFLPFAALGIAPLSAATTPITLTAFASEPDALRLWATMPEGNVVNSARAADHIKRGAQVIVLGNDYNWAGLAPGVCPRGRSFIPQSVETSRRDVSTMSDQPQFTGADLHVSVQADPPGTAFAALENNLVTGLDDLYLDPVYWEQIKTEICAAYHGDPLCHPNLPTTRQVQFNRQELSRIMSLNHPMLGDGREITYTVRVRNRGEAAANAVNLRATTWGSVRLTDAAAQCYSVAEGDYCVLDLGAPPSGGIVLAGAEHVFTFKGRVDLSFDAKRVESRGWAAIDMAIYDETTTPEAPLDWAFADHRLDVTPPLDIATQSPRDLLGPGVNTLRGVAFDQSPAPTVTLQVTNPAGQTTTIACPDDNPGAAAWGQDRSWACALDMGQAKTGDRYTLLARGTDVHGQTGEWRAQHDLIVDAAPPTLALASASEAAYRGGLIGEGDHVIQGGLADNYGVGGMQVCPVIQGVETCRAASLALDANSQPAGPRVYDDVPALPVPIADDGCASGQIVTRTFVVSDSFTVREASVGLNAAHTFRGNLRAVLSAPSGMTVALMQRWWTAWGQNVNVLFDASSAAQLFLSDDIQDHNLSGALYENRRAPDDALSRLMGQSAQGAWTLAICDDYPTRTGAYNSARLILTPDDPPRPTTAAWEYRYQVPANADGVTGTLRLYGLDSAGNRAAPLEYNFTVDTAPPVITVTTPGRVTLGQGQLQFSGQAGDTHGVRGVKLSWLDPTGRFSADTIDVPHSQVSVTWTYTNPNILLTPGVYQVWIEAEDNAGNQRIVGPLTFQVSASNKVYLPLIRR